MKKILYFEFFSQDKLNIIDYLYNNHAWSPVYASGWRLEQVRDRLKKTYKDCYCKNTEEIRQSKFEF